MTDDRETTARPLLNCDDGGPMPFAIDRTGLLFGASTIALLVSLIVAGIFAVFS